MTAPKYGATFAPKQWPACSQCDAPYLVRRAFVFNMRKGTAASRWIWQRDCRHKKAEPKLVSE
jgi:hypothetical protein